MARPGDFDAPLASESVTHTLKRAATRLAAFALAYAPRAEAALEWATPEGEPALLFSRIGLTPEEAVFARENGFDELVGRLEAPGVDEIFAPAWRSAV